MKTFEAYCGDQLVGTRTSVSRDYTHAIVVTDNARTQNPLNLDPHVFGWSMSLQSARKLARDAERRGKQLVAIVPATLKEPTKKNATAG
jgi:hypothetical protein